MNSATRISEQNKEVVVTFLNLLLADEYVLYTKTRTAHWNVDGSNYFEMHVFLENQSNEIDFIIDDLAEQIQSHGHFALGSLKNFLSIAKISEDNFDFANSGKIFETLRYDHETIIQIIQHEIKPISDEFNDCATAEFLSGILEKHKKLVWKLRLFMSDRENISNKINRITNNQSVIYGDVTPYNN
jgi:starvation-inducible DNA-binding protein